ncbi:MAG: hypothetical protein PHF86_13410 [Candidatus Nanoarchaeia archaeon]|nr:hypothetical protein [Candidatus Nanoarchaeia archaeon]
MIKFLGILDIIAGLVMILSMYMHLNFAWIFIMYVLIKSLIFFSWVSAIDIIVAIVFILSMYDIHNLLTAMGGIWLIQKGTFSLF